VFALSLVGGGVALYLTMAHLNYLALTCGELPGCAEVAAHPTSRGFGIRGLEYIPTAAFGLMMFIVMAALSFMRAATDKPSFADTVRTIQRAIAVAAVLVSAYLTYLEAAVIRAWCQWCIASAIVTVLLMVTLLLERPAPRSDTHP
jgi:uncharacterized membrane protein